MKIEAGYTIYREIIVNVRLGTWELAARTDQVPEKVHIGVRFEVEEISHSVYEQIKDAKGHK
jgi:hypothetical protein